MVLSPHADVAHAQRALAETGVKTLLVTSDGKADGKLVGIIGSRDLFACEDPSQKVVHVMTKEVVKATDPCSLEDAQAQMRTSRVSKLPVVSEEGVLISLVTSRDLKNSKKFPQASRDNNGQLLVGAAMPVGTARGAADPDNGGADWQRATALVEAGVDVLFMVGGHGDLGWASGDDQLKFLSRLKEQFPGVEVVAGPVASCRAAKRYAQAGADAIRVDGSSGGTASAAIGSACAVVGRSEATAVFEVARYCRLNYADVPVIAEGGLRSPGDILKALCLGATAAVLTDQLAGADEAPGTVSSDGVSGVKLHCRAPAPIPAVRVDCSRRASTVPAPCGHAVACKGSARDLLPYLLRALKQGMRSLGYQSLNEAHVALVAGTLRFEVRGDYSAQAAVACRQALRSSPLPEVMPAPAVAPVGMC